jgi:hypothetical protein
VPAGKLDFYIEQGATFYRKLVFKDGNQTELDLTGNQFAGKIRRTISDPNVIVEFTFSVLDQVTNPGEVEVMLTDAQTSAIPTKPQKTAERVPEKFAYDIERTLPGGRKERVLEGVAFVSPEVTK